MFFPVIVVRDFGQGAWLAFVLSNIFGATAFGYVIHNQQTSRAFIVKHYRACRLFSWLTLLFQAYFIGWVLSKLASPLANTAVVALYLMAALNQRGASLARLFSLALWLFSLACFLYFLNSPQGQALPAQLAGELQNQRWEHSYPLAIFLFGFVFCPYLDLTFHQAVSTDNGHHTRQRFLIAFPLLFLLILLYTLAYRDTIGAWMLDDAQAGNIVRGIGYFMLLQAGFTLWIHAERLRSANCNTSITYPYAAAALATLLAVAAGDYLVVAGMRVNELIYRLFMSYYGIIAPAYVWLLVWRRPGMRPRNWLLLCACALAICAIPLLTQNAGYAICYLLAVGLLVVAGLGRKTAVTSA